MALNTKKHFFVISELIYNTLEHGASQFKWHNKTFSTPSTPIFYMVRASKWDRHIDRRHRNRRAIPFGTSISCDPVRMKKPWESQFSQRYLEHLASKIPTQIEITLEWGYFYLQTLFEDSAPKSYLVSGRGVLHISPNDLTSHTLESNWNGCFALITIKLDQTHKFAYDLMMEEFRQQARNEIQARTGAEKEDRHYLSIYNYFGKHAKW